MSGKCVAIGRPARAAAALTQASRRSKPDVSALKPGAPLAAFVKSFGLLGLENTSRESRCDTSFGNFYAAVTMSGANFSLRGAMNADNPDTARIIYGLISTVMQQGISAVPDKDARKILQLVKISAKDNEIVWDADIPDKDVAEFIRNQPKAKAEVTKSPDAKKPTPRRTMRRKRTK